MSARVPVPPACPRLYLKCRASQPPGPSREAPDDPGSEHLWGRLRSALCQLLTSSMEATRTGTRGPSAWLRQTTGETVRDGGRGPSFHSSCGRWGQTLHVPEGPSWLPASGGAGPPSQGGQSTATPRPTGRAGSWRGVQLFTAQGGSLSGPTDCWAATGTLGNHRTETMPWEAEARGPQGHGDHSPRRGRPGRPSQRPRKGAHPACTMNMASSFRTEVPANDD